MPFLSSKQQQQSTEAPKRKYSCYQIITTGSSQISVVKVTGLCPASAGSLPTGTIWVSGGGNKGIQSKIAPVHQQKSYLGTSEGTSERFNNVRVNDVKSSPDSHKCIYAFFWHFWVFFYMVRIVFSRSTTWKQNENSLNKDCEVKISFNFF